MDSQSNRSLQIGNVCIQWSGLEYVLAVSIWIMLKLDIETGKIVTANLDAKQRATMAFALANQINAPVSYRNAIKKVMVALRDGLIDRRNVAVHGIHFTVSQPNSVGIEMHRGKGGRAIRILENQEFHNLGNEISALTNEFASAQSEYTKKLIPQLAAASKGLADLEAILRKTSLTNIEADK